jgi:hypothetical protein
MKLVAKYFNEGITPGEADYMMGQDLPLEPDAPRCFHFGGDTIVMVMSRVDAENFYEQGHDNFDGCSDWQEYADALREVGIGKANYDVEIEVTLSQIVSVRIEDVEDEEEAYEKAKEILADGVRDYIDVDYLFNSPTFEDWDCTED